MPLYYSSARIIFYLALPGNKVRSLLYRGFKRNQRKGFWVCGHGGLDFSTARPVSVNHVFLNFEVDVQLRLAICVGMRCLFL